MSDRDPVVKALDVKRLREDEVFQEAMQRAHEAILQEWEHGETVATRERAHVKLQVLKEILQGLQQIESDGAVEEHKRNIAARRYKI